MLNFVNSSLNFQSISILSLKMLSRLQTQAILLTKKAYFYLPSLPVEWEISKGRFVWVNTPKRWIYTILQCINAFFLAVQASFAIYLFVSSGGLPRYHVSLLIEHVLISLESYTALGLCILVILNREKVEIMNALIKTRHRFYQGKFSKESKFKHFC